MALTDLTLAQLVQVTAAAASYRALFDPPNAALATAADVLAEAGTDYTEAMCDAIDDEVVTRVVTGRTRETTLDAAIAACTALLVGELP
jgi:hypothetical protein